MSYHDPSAQSYLEATVRTAPPARLRLLLIERGVELCRGISARWRVAPTEGGCDEQTLHLSDILTELLSAVGRSDLPVAKQVADLYVFLIQHLGRAEAACDAAMIDELRRVLETEAETWRTVCAQTSKQESCERSLAPAIPNLGSIEQTHRSAPSGTFNLQG